MRINSSPVKGSNSSRPNPVRMKYQPWPLISGWRALFATRKASTVTIISTRIESRVTEECSTERNRSAKISTLKSRTSKKRKLIRLIPSRRIPLSGLSGI